MLSSSFVNREINMGFPNKANRVPECLILSSFDVYVNAASNGSEMDSMIVSNHERLIGDQYISHCFICHYF